MSRFIIAAIVALLGIVVAVVFLFKGRVIMAVSTLLTGFYVAFTVIFGFYNSLEDPLLKLIVVAIGAIGLVGVFTSNRAFNINLQNAHAEALYEILTLETHCTPMSAELLDIQKSALPACAMQSNSDQQAAVIELGKGLYFGPRLSLIDSTVSISGADRPDYCAQIYKAAITLCPTIVYLTSKESHNALISAAK